MTLTTHGFIKDAKGLCGFPEGKETPRSCKCQLYMINESTGTNKLVSKLTQGHAVLMQEDHSL